MTEKYSGCFATRHSNSGISVQGRMADLLSECVNGEVKDVSAWNERVRATLKEFYVSPLSEKPKLSPDARNAIENAACKLQSLGRTFSGHNFTDRYGDGPLCLDLAEKLRRALNE